MNIDKNDFKDIVKNFAEALSKGLSKQREVTIPLEEYEYYKNKSIKYGKIIDEIYNTYILVLGNDYEDLDKKYLFDNIYKIYEKICNLDLEK